MKLLKFCQELPLPSAWKMFEKQLGMLSSPGDVNTTWLWLWPWFSRSTFCNCTIWKQSPSKHSVRRCQRLFDFVFTHISEWSEFKTLSISVKTVKSSPYVNLAEPRVFFKQPFLLLGDRSILNFHSIPWLWKNCWTPWLLKVFALSETNSLFTPLWAKNLFKLLMKDCAFNAGTKTRWTALQYAAQFSATKKVNLYFLPWNSREDLKFHTQLASAFSLHM